MAANTIEAVRTSVATASSDEVNQIRRQEGKAGGLYVGRTDIWFSNRTFETVDISICVTNRAPVASAPTQAVLSAAPLGAFLPWEPLETVHIPRIEPFGTYFIETQARRRRRTMLDAPNRMPPGRLFTALGEDDDDDQASRPRTGWFAALRGLYDAALPGARRNRKRLPGAATLPSDPLDLLTSGNLHWAGNLNIFIGGQSVERHIAQALRVYPEHLNLAMFFVGTVADRYTFDLQGEAVAWQARLIDTSGGNSVIPDADSLSIPLRQPIALRRGSMVLLALVPPKGCSQGCCEVHATQESTGEKALVEFSLDARAAGPGCYVV